MFHAVSKAQPPVAEAGTADHPARGRYLTDGTNLFRVLGGLHEGSPALLVEDCKSLDAIVLDAARAQDLRTVMATAQLGSAAGSRDAQVACAAG